MIDFIDGFMRAMVFLVGAIFGSFLNVCISRWPDGESVVRPRSRCPRCGNGIAWYDNVPMLSWLVLRGRCRHCREPISPVYPLVELVVGLIWLASMTEFGLTFTALRMAVFATLLLGVTLTDAARYVIPDGFTIFGFVFGLAAAAASLFIGDGLPFASLYDAFMGACVGAGAIAIATWLGEAVLKREAMGFGDVTLMAMIGAFLGPQRTLLTVFFGALLGSIVFLVIVFPIGWVKSRKREGGYAMPLVPFGVFLAPAALVALWWGAPLIDWYTRRMLGL